MLVRFPWPVGVLMTGRGFSWFVTTRPDRAEPGAGAAHTAALSDAGRLSRPARSACVSFRLQSASGAQNAASHTVFPIGRLSAGRPGIWEGRVSERFMRTPPQR